MRPTVAATAPPMPTSTSSNTSVEQLADFGQHDLNRETKTRQLAARRDARHRTQRLLGVRGDLQLDAFEPEAGRLGNGDQGNLDPAAGHRQPLHHRAAHDVPARPRQACAWPTTRSRARRTRAAPLLPRSRAARHRHRRPGPQTARDGLLGERGSSSGLTRYFRARVVNRSQPRFDAGKLARIEVEPLAIGPQRPRSFVGTYSCLVAKRHHVVQRRVVREPPV